MKEDIIISAAENMLSQKKIERLNHQQYRIVGNHSAVKVCHWCKKSLRGEGGCYKENFYGVNTLNCLEMSPAITCNQRCRHCWRDTSVFSRGWIGPVDDPGRIIDGCIKAREELICGFKGNDKVKLERYKDSLRIDHAAISLTGEPCMYPLLPELIDEFFSRGCRTVFLVTSGTVPDMLEKFNRYPTNLYLSVETADKGDYKRFCMPVIEDGWEKVQKSIEIIRNMEGKCNRVMRITCVKGFNMDTVDGFVDMIERMRPDYVETKGYMHIGYSRKRLSRDNQPAYAEVKEFADRLSEKTGYLIKDEMDKSHVVLLKRR